MRQHLAVRAENHAIAIEDELVLAADQVRVSDECPVIGSAARNHLFTRPALAGVIRRTVDVDQQLGALVGLPSHRAGWVPAVLADRHTDFDAGHLEYGTSMPDCEIALLVEHPVVGQEHLVVDGLDLTVMHEGGGVVEVAILVDETDDRRDPLGRAGHDLQVLQVVAHEPRLEHEVFRRVAGDRQLGKRHDIDALVAGAPDPVCDQASVAFQVAHDCVDLCQPDPDLPLHESMLATI